jgi:polysaccharide pyruvyl transferase WcaK-like protein
VTPFTIARGYSLGDRATQLATVHVFDDMQRSCGCGDEANVSVIGPGNAVGSNPPIFVGNKAISYVRVDMNFRAIGAFSQQNDLGTYSLIAIMGADVLDGRYGKGERTHALAQLATSATAKGVLVAVLSLTYDRVDRTDLSKFPSTTCFRPRSQGSAVVISKKLEVPDRQCDGRPRVSRTADSVYMLQPRSPPTPWAQQTIQWIHSQRSEERFVLGVNLFMYPEARRSVPAQFPMVETLAKELCSAAETLKLSILFIPHDFRKPGEDANVLKHVGGAIHEHCGSVHLPTKLMNDGNPDEPDDELAVVKELDLVVSGFMHLLIITSNSGTPVVAIHGQEKHTQLLRDLYGPEETRGETLPKLEIQPAEIAAKAGAYSSFIVDAIRVAPQLRKILVSGVQKMKALSKANFEDIFDKRGCC